MVSVLLAAYQGASYLPEQLASLESQQFTDFRILWQDDGSSDATPALLASMGQRYIPGTQQGLHLGPAGNFISLMRQDDAPYTALCDQDDVWHSDRLLRGLTAIREAEARMGTDVPLLVHSDARIIAADGACLHDSLFRHQGWRGDAASLQQLIVQNNVTGCTILMNAALRNLVCAHAQPEKLYMHDWFIAMTAAAFGSIIFLPEPLVDYRQHGSNAMGASRSGLVRRAAAAMAAPEQARARIRLTYDHTRMFREAFGDRLPDAAARIIDDYLAAGNLPRLKRIASIRQGGYVMQSPIARLGQIIFG